MDKIRRNKRKRMVNTYMENKTATKIQMSRQWAMPNSKTFKIKPIRELIAKVVMEYAEEVGRPITVIDPFANEGSIAEEFDGLEIIYITNDLDTQYDTDHHLEASEFIGLFDSGSIDIVLYDPPYSPRQVSEVYKEHGLTVNMETTQSSYWGNQKKEISRITKQGGKVITFGWNSGGIGKVNGFEIQEVLIVPHGGWHNDTICTVDERQ